MNRTQHEDFFVIDGHNDTVLAHKFFFRNFAKGSSRGQMDRPRLKAGNVQASVFALCNARTPFLLKLFSKMWFALVNDPKNELMHIKQVDDLHACRNAGKIGAILGLEGADAIDSDLRILEHYHEKGLRVMGVVWNNANKFGKGVKATDPQREGGLTNLGKALVVKAQDLGITVDVSHMNEQAFHDTIEVAKRPVFASHSNARAICDHPRNLTDDQLKILHEKGGCTGLNFGTKFLDPNRDPKLSFSGIKKHVDYIVNLTSIDMVAMGADFDGTSVPESVSDCSKYPALFDYLLENGYSKADLEKIASGNFSRVFKATWR